MAGRRKKGHKAGEAFEINVTPMVDMFSVLISFLLVTAVFSATGQARVDVPFLSSKAPEEPKKEDKDPPKSLTLVVEENLVELQISDGKPGVEPEKFEYQLVEAGLDELQGRIYDVRKEDLRVDLVTVMSDDEVEYEKLVLIIDALRVLRPHRDPIELPDDYKFPRGVSEEALIPKIVMGSVIL